MDRLPEHTLEAISVLWLAAFGMMLELICDQDGALGGVCFDWISCLGVLVRAGASSVTPYHGAHRAPWRSIPLALDPLH